MIYAAFISIVCSMALSARREQAFQCQGQAFDLGSKNNMMKASPDGRNINV